LKKKKEKKGQEFFFKTNPKNVFYKQQNLFPRENCPL